MIRLKIKNEKVYPSYYSKNLVLFSGEIRSITEEKLTQDIVDDIKVGYLEIVSGEIPSNLLYDKQEGGF